MLFWSRGEKPHRSVVPNIMARPKSGWREGFKENSIIMKGIKLCISIQTERSRKVLAESVLMNTSYFNILHFDCCIRFNVNNVKAIPLQALTGSEGSRRLRLPDLKTIGT
jgi:hypothetical protein